MSQRAFGLWLMVAGVALAIGSYVHYKAGEDDRRHQGTVAILSCTQRNTYPCPDPTFDYTKNWVAAGFGAALVSTGILVAATGGTKVVVVPSTPAAGTAPPPRDDSGDSVAEALAKLDALRERGLVNDDEYTAKRTEILGRL